MIVKSFAKQHSKIPANNISHWRIVGYRVLLDGNVLCLKCKNKGASRDRTF